MLRYRCWGYGSITLVIIQAPPSVEFLQMGCSDLLGETPPGGTPGLLPVSVCPIQSGSHRSQCYPQPYIPRPPNKDQTKLRKALCGASLGLILGGTTWVGCIIGIYEMVLGMPPVCGKAPRTSSRPTTQPTVARAVEPKPPRGQELVEALATTGLIGASTTANPLNPNTPIGHQGPQCSRVSGVSRAGGSHQSQTLNLSASKS